MIRKLSLGIRVFICFAGFMVSCSSTEEIEGGKVYIGISWRADLSNEFYTNVCKAIIQAGGTPVLLQQVKSDDAEYDDNGKLKAGYISENDYLESDIAEKVKLYSYKHSNISDVMQNVNAVVFTGGEDISPTLLDTPEEWHGIEAEKDYNATRDISDYILMSYCIDKDIAVLGFCRGMQMLSVVSGATVIQDIPTYFADQGIMYNYEHRNEKVGDEYRDYAPHDVTVSVPSILYDIVDTTTIYNVPSWHHQAVKSVENTPLMVTGVRETQGLPIIEAVERKDKSFILGLQFHPEAAIVKNLENAANKNKFMDYDTSMKFFYKLVSLVKDKQNR